MLNDLEVQALNAILDRAIAEADDDDPEFKEVAAANVNPFGDAITQSSVYDSLSKKGFVQCSGSPDDEASDAVCITPSGLTALKEANGVH